MREHGAEGLVFVCLDELHRLLREAVSEVFALWCVIEAHDGIFLIVPLALRHGVRREKRARGARRARGDDGAKAHLIWIRRALAEMPFSAVKRAIARRLKRLAKRRIALRLDMRAVILALHACRMLSRQNAKARRHTARIGDIGLRELRPARRQSVHVRCFIQRGAVAAEIPRAEVVDEDEEDVRLRLCEERRAKGKEEEKGAHGGVMEYCRSCSRLPNGLLSCLTHFVGSFAKSILGASLDALTE